MISVVTRVSSASVEIDSQPSAHPLPTPDSRRTSGEAAARISAGLLALLAVEPGDTDQTVAWMAKKLSHLRIFPDEEGRMNRSLLDTGGSILLVSQFTLAGDCAKGHRPSFIGAAPPEIAEPTYERVADALRAEYGLNVRTGVFGAAMRVSSVNEGPVTLIVRAS